MAALHDIVDYISYYIIHAAKFPEKIEHISHGCLELMHAIPGDNEILQTRVHLAKLKSSLLSAKSAQDAKSLISDLASKVEIRKGPKARSLKAMQVWTVLFVLMSGRTQSARQPTDVAAFP